MKDNKTGDFVVFVRTKQFWQSRFRSFDPQTPVFISHFEISERLNNPIKDIQLLIDAGEIEVFKKMTNKGFETRLFRANHKGGINPKLLKPKTIELDNLTNYMRNTLKCVTLTENAKSTDYFNTFLALKNQFIELFFTIDEFSSRIHTPITSFHRECRPNILLDGLETTSIDVATMQPLLLGKILKHAIGENEYSNWINTGEDIYLIIQEKTKLATRDEAKKRFFEILFSKPNKQLSEMFGGANWIEWINEFKSKLLIQNPHSIEKNHSNLAWLLQKTEVTVMRKVWQSLKNNNILFLSVHDEVIIQTKYKNQAERLFREVLDQEFKYYKLSNK